MTTKRRGHKATYITAQSALYGSHLHNKLKKSIAIHRTALNFGHCNMHCITLNLLLIMKRTIEKKMSLINRKLEPSRH